MWYGNVASGAVPVPYRCGTVRCRVGMDFGTLIDGSSDEGGTLAGTKFVPYGLDVYDSALYGIARCGEVHKWYCCGLVVSVVFFFGWESLVCV